MCVFSVHNLWASLGEKGVQNVVLTNMEKLSGAFLFSCLFKASDKEHLEYVITLSAKQKLPSREDMWITDIAPLTLSGKR